MAEVADIFSAAIRYTALPEERSSSCTLNLKLMSIRESLSSPPSEIKINTSRSLEVWERNLWQRSGAQKYHLVLQQLTAAPTITSTPLTTTELLRPFIES